MSATKIVPVNSLVLDYDYYPRSSVSLQHVGYLVESLVAGDRLPPVIVDKKTRKVIDGFHRCKANLRLHGEEATVEVEELSYKSDKEAFEDAMRRNATHGLGLDRHDRVHCAILAKQHGISLQTVAQCIHMSIKQFKTLLEHRVATNAVTGEEVALKRTVEHKAGDMLTPAQVEANRKLGGMDPKFFVNQVILLIENDMWNRKDAAFLERLKILGGLIDDLLAGKKK